MRFRVKNIKKGHCEVWANERDGQRYERIAFVKRLDKGWHWSATDYLVLPEDNYVAQGTRRECIADCKRTALKRLVEHAIEQQPHESPHWHSPRRDALCAVEDSHVFTWEEREEIKGRLLAFD